MSQRTVSTGAMAALEKAVGTGKRKLLRADFDGRNLRMLKRLGYIQIVDKHFFAVTLAGRKALR